MPIFNDPLLLPEQLQKRKATLLVFVGDAGAQADVTPVVQALYTDTTARKELVAIFFPIRRDPQDHFVASLWQRHNPEGVSPHFVLMGRGGTEVESLGGQAQLDELAARVSARFRKKS
jgi:hypothetical protein